MSPHHGWNPDGSRLTRRRFLNAVALASRSLIAWPFVPRLPFLPAFSFPHIDIDFTGARPMSESPQTPEDNPYRLPRHVRPSRYELYLEPDLASRTFTGQATVSLEVTQRTADIILNAAELEILSATIDGPSGHRAEGRITLQPDRERCVLRFPTALEPGTWHLELSFTGMLNDKLRGFYRSTYSAADGTKHTMAATQFEATDARRAFPCWDEPDFKAVFAVTLAIDPDLVALSNAAVRSVETRSGKKIVRFADTMTMSTYLVAFVVGQLEGTDPVMVGTTPVRIWTVPGKQHLTRFGLDIAAYSLAFFSEYYGIPYPGDKLDLIAIPDFASGAMENLGAITFRETALLVDQTRATRSERERVADVVAHENAHMWFGDLVTMSWWNGLWLNEAFATFMEMLAVDTWKPEWERWASFSVSRAAALAVDGLHSTRPIEYPVLAPKDADAMFDVLTYEKGASVLRMLEQYIGPDTFREGVRLYLRNHAYGNADTKDLWISMAAAAKDDIPDLLNEWVFGPGYPLVSADLTGPTEVTISQQRFIYLATASSGEADQQATRQIWHVPIHVKIFQGDRMETRRLMLSEEQTTLRLPEQWTSLILNEGGHGFYRVRYGTELLARLEQDGLTHLTPVERFNLVNDTWASALAQMIPPNRYLALTGHFKMERDHNVWSVLLGSFSTLDRVLTADDRPLLQRFVQDRLQPAAHDLGWAPRRDESDLTRELRGDLLRALGTLGDHSDTQHEAAQLYAAEQDHPGTVDPNLLPALVSVLAFTGDEGRYEEFLERFRKTSTPQEERRFLYALAAFRSPQLLKRTLHKTLNGEIRTQDAPMVVGAVLHNIYGRDAAWAFVKKHWDEMDRLFPKNGLRRMCGGIVALATPELEQDVREFFTSKKIDLGGKTLQQYFEQLHIAVSFRERSTEAVRAYLRDMSASS
jgi:puromycin-sensitive aminopeptidase